jgi:hypothetical protein
MLSAAKKPCYIGVNPARVATVGYHRAGSGWRCSLNFTDGTVVYSDTADGCAEARAHAERKLSEDYPGFTSQG